MAVITVDLLAGQGGIALGAPINRAVFSVSQIMVVQLDKKPLGPAVIFRVCRDHFPAPVDHGTHAFQLGTHVFNILVRPGHGMNFPGDSSIFCWQAKGIKAHREHDIIALHALKAGPGIRGRHGIPVADMQIPRWIWEHGQGIKLLFTFIHIRLVEAVCLPALLPFGFYFLRVVFSCHDVLSLIAWSNKILFMP